MGVFGRLSRIIKSNINSLLDAAEDPEKSLNQLVGDMKKSYREAKGEVAQSMVDERKIERKLEKAKVDVVKWTDKAKLAVRKGKDDMAKQALLRAKSAKSIAEELLKQLEQQRRAVSNLKLALSTLEKKIEEAKAKRHVLIARKRTVETSQKITARVDNVKVDKSAFDEFDRIAEKIEDMEIKAGIMLEMSADRLEERFEEEQASDEMDLELESLKEEMGLIEGGSKKLLEDKSVKKKRRKKKAKVVEVEEDDDEDDEDLEDEDDEDADVDLDALDDDEDDEEEVVVTKKKKKKK